MNGVYIIYAYNINIYYTGILGTCIRVYVGQRREANGVIWQGGKKSKVKKRSRSSSQCK